MNKNTVIVIPIYKKYSELNKVEFKLLEQIKTVLSNHEILIILAQYLQKEWSQYNEFKTICFKDIYFKDKFSYSKLLCRKQFYQFFSDFHYIQIIQTDCWVFGDELDFFSNLGFDYIGVPWMVGGFDGRSEENLWKTGNGGFSLRKVSSFISIIDQIKSSQKSKIHISF